MNKLPTFSGYCPPGQLRSMTRCLAAQAVLAAQVQQLRQAPDSAQHCALVQQASLPQLAQRSRRADLLLLGLAVLLAVAYAVAKPTPPAPTHFEEHPPLHRSTIYWD